MVVAGDRRGRFDPTCRLRHRLVPTRTFGSKLIVARPRDGAPVVLAPTAAVVWRQTGTWTTLREVVQRLGDAFPYVDERERMNVASAILGLLEDDDLIERV